jgi:hypothetical protein
MKKVITTLSKIVIIITVLNVFAWSIFHVYSGGKMFGVLTNGIKVFAEFPTMVTNVLKELVNPERLNEANSNFEEINNLSHDIFALNSTFQQGQWNTRLTNLKNDSVLFQWTLDEKYFYSTGRVFSHSGPRLPIILKDTSLILFNNESFNLFRLNSNSQIIWKNNDFQFHHAINLDHAGSIWACTRKRVVSVNHNVRYWDNYITKVDVETGKTLFHKSLTKIFLDNNLNYLIHGVGNMVPSNGEDPYHLNEIEPVLTDGKFWKQGDLFLSLRHRSMVFLYRPSTNKIIRIIQGDFYNQHDVDIVSDSTISIFNNNISSLKHYNATKDKFDSLEFLPNERLNQTSEVLLFNLSDSTFSSLYPNQFAANNIYTTTQGRQKILSNGDLFVEEYMDGKIFIFNENEILLKKYVNKPQNGRLEYPHWIRIYEDLEFLK